MYGNSGVHVVTRVYCMGGGFQNAELFSEEFSTRNAVSSSYIWYVVLCTCMYVCLLLLPHGVTGWRGVYIYISHAAIGVYISLM